MAPRPKKAPRPVDRYGDPLPAGALLRLGTDRLRVGPGVVRAAAFAPDGGRVAAAEDAEGSLHVWSATTGALTQRIAARKTKRTLDGADDLAFSPDGLRVVSVASEVLRFFDLGAAEEHATVEGDAFNHVAFSPDGRVVVVTRGRLSMHVHDAATGRRLHEIEAPHATGAVAFAPDGRSFAVMGYADETVIVRLFDAVTFAPRGDFTPLGPPREGARRFMPTLGFGFSPDSATIAVVFPDEALTTFDVASGVSRARRPWPGLLDGCADWPRYRFSDDLAQLAVFTGGVTRVHDVAGMVERCRFPATRLGVFSRDGLGFAAPTDCAVRLRDPATGAERVPLAAHDAPAVAIGFSADGRRVITGGDETLQAWDARTGAPLGVLDHGFPRALSVGPSGVVAPRFVTRGDAIALRDTVTGALAQTLAGEGKDTHDFAQSPDGSLVVAARGRHVLFWSASSGRLLHQIDPYGGKGVYALTFGPDGRTLALAGWDDEVQRWELSMAEAWAPPRRLRGFAGRSFCYGPLAFSPDGRRLASACRDHRVRVWEVEGGGLVHELEGHARTPAALAFSADGARLASADTRSVRLWSAETGQPLGVVKQGARALAFSADGAILAAGVLGGALLWDAQALGG